MTETAGALTPEQAAEIRRRMKEKYGDTDSPPPARTGPVFEESDIAGMLRHGVPARKILIPELVYDEPYVHAFNGHPDSGKTVVVADIAHQAMKLGRPVIWLDYEMGERETTHRLQDMGVDAALVERHFHHYDAPPWSVTNAAHIAELDELCASCPGALVVVDSNAGALASMGLDEDKAADYTVYVQAVGRRLSRRNGSPVILIDHATKTTSKGARFTARGSGAKKAGHDVEWWVEKTADFSRDEVGQMWLWRHKDRGAVMPKGLCFKVGNLHDEAYGSLRVERDLDPESPADTVC